MKVYMTTGTLDFLSKKKTSHPTETMLLLERDGEGLLYHEGADKTLFETPRNYESIDSVGDPTKGAFVVFNNIPVSDEGRPVFEYRFKKRAGLIEKEPGFAAIRVLRPLSSDTYIIATFWDEEASFKEWQSSQAYNKAHEKRGTENGVDKEEPSIFLRPSYVTTYTVVLEK